MKRIFILCLTCLISVTTVVAQPDNNDCATAFALPLEIEYCSGQSGFTTERATPTLVGDASNDYPICFQERREIKDVWFSFVAQRNSVNVSVFGATQANPGGSLRAPQFALFEGSCEPSDSRDAIGCRSPFEDQSTGQLLNGGNIIYNELNVGQTYFILVSARNGNEGSFELCVNQFNAVAEPSGDCGTGVILCDKSPFVANYLQGLGAINEDLLSSNIDCEFPPVEQNSAWYKWTCDQAGSLTFVITPLGAAANEDIDFVLYELGGDLSNCDDRMPIRQMFSGEITGEPPSESLPCLGETGLSTEDTNRFENCGCSPGDNNFVQSIDMVPGRSYALLIMNFSGSGDGFEIEFGGSGTFLGPEADFSTTTSEACVGEALVFEDQSTSLDIITSREWDFGPTATPRFATGPGPHSVVFGEPGNPLVQLVIETERDCREVARAQDVQVICCEGQLSGEGLVSPVLCPNTLSGAIDLTAASNFAPGTLTYLWSNGATSEDIDNLDLGDYEVTITDESSCFEVYSFTVDGPDPFTFDTLIGMPDCGGGTNGTLEFTVTGGGAGDYEYSLNGGPFLPEATLTGLGISTVNIVVRDANNCLVEQDFDIDELELGLQRGVELFTDPACAADDNGTITVAIANGVPSYRFSLNGAPYQNSNRFTGLTAGAYTVEAIDAEGCLGIFDFNLTDPPNLEFNPEGFDISCFGFTDGAINMNPSGGRPAYRFRLPDGTTSTSDTLTGLAAGIYPIELIDSNGCVRRKTVVLEQPGQLNVEIIDRTNLACFRDSTGNFTVKGSGGTPGYLYSTDNETYQTDSLLAGLQAGDLTLYIMDANGCRDSIAGTLNQPVEFIIDGGSEGIIQLGYDTTLRAVSNYMPVNYFWGPDSLQCLDPLCSRVRAAPVRTTDYTVIGVNEAGCTDSATVRLVVIDERPLYIPSAFSPNGDGQNDRFTIYGGPAVQQIDQLRIYNRWGGLVYEGVGLPINTPSLGWGGEVDGKLANSAVFVYYATVRFINGSTTTVSGDVTLVR